MPEDSAPVPGFPEDGTRLPAGTDILIVTLRTGFPNGMAAAARIHLIARALAEGGARPAVIHMNTSETSEPFRNTETSGISLGIPFRYACGVVARPASFARRRACTIRGFLRTCRLISSGASHGDLRAVLFYERSIFSLLPVMILCRIHGIRFALDLVEWPPALEAVQDLLGRLSLRLYARVALRAADRITAISRFLADRATEIRGGSGSVLYLPILGDEEGSSAERNPVPGRFVISISGGYSRELCLALEAFSLASEARPDAELHITGGVDDRTLERLMGSCAEGSRPTREILSRVRCRGYLPRRSLMELYATCSAGVAVLGDDLRSRSRMPTKIAEYAFSGLPLVVAEAGDVPGLFDEGRSAFLYRPGDRRSLADAMLRAMGDPLEVEKVGARGREIALGAFSFRRHAERLTRFLLAGGGPA